MSQPEITAIFLPNQVYLFEPFKSKYLIFSSELHIWVFSKAHWNVRDTEVLLECFIFVIFKWFHMVRFSGRYFGLYSTKSNGLVVTKKMGLVVTLGLVALCNWYNVQMGLLLIYYTKHSIYVTTKGVNLRK